MPNGLIEIIVGIVLILIPEPATTAIGVALTIYGGKRMISSGKEKDKLAAMERERLN